MEAFNEVPPTATTYWELAGQLGVVPPVPHSSAPESPEEMENVWPWASAALKMVSSEAADPSLLASVSHSPMDTLMTFTALAVTIALKSAVMLASDSDGMS